MAAFGYGIGKPEDETILTGLQAVGGEQTQPSGPEGSAASQGALGAPAPVGDDSTAFGEVGGAGPVNPFGGPQTPGVKLIDYYDDPKYGTTPEQQIALADEMDNTLGKQGSGVIAEANKKISEALKQGDMQTLSSALEWGWTPEEEMAGQKNLGSEFTVQEGEMGALGGEIESGQAAGETEGGGKPKWDRKRMGGFLMEFGLRMLASENKTTAGAFGEAALGTIDARDKRKKTKAAEDLAKSDREREQRREDEGDLHKRQKAERDKRKEARDIKKAERDAEKADREGLTRIVMPDGTVEYGKIKDGVVTRKDGTEIQGIDPSTQSAESMSAVVRQEIGLRAKIDTALTKALSDRIRKPPRGDADLYAIQQAKNDKEKKRLMKKYKDAKFNELKGNEDAEANPFELDE